MQMFLGFCRHGGGIRDKALRTSALEARNKASSDCLHNNNSLEQCNLEVYLKSLINNLLFCSIKQEEMHKKCVMLIKHKSKLTTVR